MSDARTAAGPSIVDRITRMENDLRNLRANSRRLVVTGILAAYDGNANTATVVVDGLVYEGIPLAYGLPAWAARAGANVQAACGVIGFNASTPEIGCVFCVYSTTRPPDPFSPETGHRHTGVLDDGPIL
jgi:hypothetical protein